MIALHDVTLRIGSRTLVREISASLPRNELIAVLGPNGVGKTTLLRSMAGLHRAYDGTVRENGDDLRRLSHAERARRVAYVASDDMFAEGMTVRDVVATGRFAHQPWWRWEPTAQDRCAVDEALEDVRIAWAADRLFSTLSSGERQRAWIAMGLAQSARVVLLDEPTSHLDVRVAHDILRMLHDVSRAGKTVVAVLHDLNDAAAYADRLLLLGCERMLAFGSPDEVLRPDLLRDAYGVDMERVTTAVGGVRVFPIRL